MNQDLVVKKAFGPLVLARAISKTPLSNNAMSINLVSRTFERSFWSFEGVSTVELVLHGCALFVLC